MTIDNTATAWQFIEAWAGHPGAGRAYRMAACSQRFCARLAGNDKLLAARHLAAARVLDRAARRAS